MRKYAQVAPTFWTRGSGRRLRGNSVAQALAFYFMTAPSSNLIGLYYLPITSICTELGMDRETVIATLPEISEIALYDVEAEMAWLPNAAKYNVGETLAPRDKKRAAILRELSMAGSHRFAALFMETYGIAYGFHGCPSDAASAVSAAPNSDRGIAGASARGIRASGMPPVPDPVPALRDQDPDPDQPVRSGPRATPVPTLARTPAHRSDSRRPPSNLAEAMALPLRERAEQVQQARVDAQWAEPHRWPEVLAVSDALSAAENLPRRKLGQYGSDPGVRALVARFAEDWSPDAIVALLPRIVGSDWWRAKPRGLSDLSPEVLDRAQRAQAASGPRASAGTTRWSPESPASPPHPHPGERWATEDRVAGRWVRGVDTRGEAWIVGADGRLRQDPSQYVPPPAGLAADLRRVGIRAPEGEAS